MSFELRAGGHAVAKAAAERASVARAAVVVGVVERGEDGRDALLGFDEQVLEIQQDGLLAALVDEGRGDTRLAAAARAADSMHVVLNLLGHVEVDDVLNLGKVEALGGNVGADEHVLLAFAEHVDCVLALCLVLTAVDRDGRDALEHQVLVDIVTLRLRLAKDEDWRRRLLQALKQVDDLRLLLDVLHLLDHVQIGRARSADIDDHRTHERRLGESLNLIRHRRREQQCLPLVLKEGHGLAYLLLEAGVANESVGLVQAQVLAQRQAHALLLKHVIQTAGRRNTHMEALPDRLELIRELRAADRAKRA
mmetsp:Transcript_45128/g.118390  ORF Transcript_45128/g.118390 Transcript_45128/m.118390 type:complete len:308 (+) Transcript_45128:198-1121(+)